MHLARCSSIRPSATPTHSNLFLPPSLAASPVARYQPQVVRSPAVHAPGVRSDRSCHTQPTRPWESPVRPAVGSGRSSHTRLQQPASRSASGRVLSPPYAAVRPDARSTGGRVVSVRHARPAAHTLRMAVRSATFTRSSAHARSTGQRGRQRLQRNGYPTAAACHRPPYPGCSTCGRHSAAPTRDRSRAATALLTCHPHQLHRQAPAGSWQPTGRRRT